MKSESSLKSLYGRSKNKKNTHSLSAKNSIQGEHSGTAAKLYFYRLTHKLQ